MMSASSGSLIHRAAFEVLASVSAALPGLPTTPVHHWLARRGYGRPSFRWARDRFGNQLKLSPHLYLDRILLCSREYDPPLHQLLGRLVSADMVCLDVGANIGTVSLHLARLVGSNGHVHAFEPAPTVVDRLRAHVVRNDLAHIITVHAFALGAAAGVADFAFADVATENQGMGSLVNRGNEVAALATKVEVRTLDEFAATTSLSRLDVIKVDIQGAEPLFVRGAVRTLERFRPSLLMEISPEDLPHAGSSPPLLLRELHDLGYTRAFSVENAALHPVRHEDVHSRSHFENVLFMHRATALPSGIRL